MARTSKEQKTPSDFLSRLDPTKQHAIALTFLFVLPMILFFEPILGGKQYVGHDTIQWRAGAESIIEYREKTGDEPLWAENMFSGMPAYVISYKRAVPQLDSVLFALSSVLHPGIRYWVLLAGIYLLLIMMKVRPFSAALGSIFIGFTTYIPIIIGAGHNTKFGAYAFIPWMFVGYLMITRSDRRLLGFFTFAMATVLELRASHPQVTYYFLYLMAFWWIYDGIKAFRSQNQQRWFTDTALLTAGGLLGVAGNLQHFWSLLEYSPFTIRGGSALEQGASGLNLEYAFSWSQGVGELLTLIIPGLYGGASTEAYWGPKSFTSGPHYLGGIAFLLFLFGMLLSRRNEKYLFFGVGFLTMLFSLGYHFPALNEVMFKYMPYFNKFRTPEMWLIVTVFCFSIVAVLGIEAIIDHVQEFKALKASRIYLPIAIALVIGAAFSFSAGSLLSFEKPGEREQYAQYLARQNNISPDNPQVQQRVRQIIARQLKPDRAKTAQSDAFRFLLMTALAGGLIFAYYKRKLSVGYLLAGLLLISAYDMLSVGERYDNEESLREGDIDRERVIQNQRRPLDRFIQERVETDTWPYRVYPFKDNPFNNAVPAYFYPSLGGYTGAKLSIYQDLVDEHISAFNTEVLSMLNTRYIITGGGAVQMPRLKQAYAGQDGVVMENTEVLPKAFFVDSVAVAASAEEAIAMLSPERGFDASEWAILEQEPPFQPISDLTASVEVTEYGPRLIELVTDRSEPGFLVLSEIYYPPGWRAYLDDGETPIYKTNYVLRGIFVPEGQHRIRLENNPASHRIGIPVTWAANGTIWIIGVLALLRWYRTREQDRVDAA